jgi:hypothetical protein
LNREQSLHGRVRAVRPSNAGADGYVSVVSAAVAMVTCQLPGKPVPAGVTAFLEGE